MVSSQPTSPHSEGSRVDVIIANHVHSCGRDGARRTQARATVQGPEYPSKEEAERAGGNYRVLHGMRGIAGVRRILPGRRLHVLGTRRGPSAVRADPGGPDPLHRLQEMHQQRTGWRISRWLSLGRDRHGGYGRSRKRSRRDATVRLPIDDSNCLIPSPDFNFLPFPFATERDKSAPPILLIAYS